MDDRQGYVSPLQALGALIEKGSELKDQQMIQGKYINWGRVCHSINQSALMQ